MVGVQRDIDRLAPLFSARVSEGVTRSGETAGTRVCQRITFT